MASSKILGFEILHNKYGTKGRIKQLFYPPCVPLLCNSILTTSLPLLRWELAQLAGQLGRIVT